MDESCLAPFVDFFFSAISFSVLSVSLLTFPPRSINSLASPFARKTSSLSPSRPKPFLPLFIHNLFPRLPSLFPLQPPQPFLPSSLRFFRTIPISQTTKTLIVSQAARSTAPLLTLRRLSRLHGFLHKSSFTY